MSTFRFNAKVQDPFSDITDAALGTTGQGWGNEEVGKAVKLSSANNYILCTNGDEIEGFVVSMEPVTVNGGVSFGSVQRNGRMLAKLASGVTGAAVGNFVVCLLYTSHVTMPFSSPSQTFSPRSHFIGFYLPLSAGFLIEGHAPADHYSETPWSRQSQNCRA